MRKIVLTLCFLSLGAGALVWSAFAEEPVPDAKKRPVLRDEEEKTLYAIGVKLGRGLALARLTEAEFEIVMRGAADAAFRRELAVNPDDYRMKMTELIRERRDAAAEEEKRDSIGFLKKEGEKPGAVVTDSGLVYTELEAGEGASPKATDLVSFTVRRTLRDGSRIDAAGTRDRPFADRLSRVAPALREAMLRMKVGGKARLACTAELAFADPELRGLPRGTAVVIVVELIGILPDDGK